MEKQQQHTLPGSPPVPGHLPGLAAVVEHPREGEARERICACEMQDKVVVERANGEVEAEEGECAVYYWSVGCDERGRGKGEMIFVSRGYVRDE